MTILKTLLLGSKHSLLFLLVSHCLQYTQNMTDFQFGDIVIDPRTGRPIDRHSDPRRGLHAMQFMPVPIGPDPARGLDLRYDTPDDRMLPAFDYTFDPNVVRPIINRRTQTHDQLKAQLREELDLIRGTAETIRINNRGPLRFEYYTNEYNLFDPFGTIRNRRMVYVHYLMNLPDDQAFHRNPWVTPGEIWPPIPIEFRYRADHYIDVTTPEPAPRPGVLEIAHPPSIGHANSPTGERYFDVFTQPFPDIDQRMPNADLFNFIMLSLEQIDVSFQRGFYFQDQRYRELAARANGAEVEILNLQEKVTTLELYLVRKGDVSGIGITPPGFIQQYFEAWENWWPTNRPPRTATARGGTGAE